MTHEFKKIIQQSILNQQKNIQNVLATVVDLDGSSYRKPGVRMLLSSDDKMVGAVSGGCVEKEIQRRAQTVFNDGKSKVITYDGRYRLGCEGVLYILLEPFFVSKDFLKAFTNNLEERNSFQLHSYYKKEDESFGNLGSEIQFKDGEKFTFSNDFKPKDSTKTLIFKQTLQPLFQLIIIGGEHDAVTLCKQANQLGWQVDIITSVKDPKKLSDFPGANSVDAQTPELIEFNTINNNTAIVIMNHNFTYDLRYLIKLEEQSPIYIGVLGAAKRREKLLNELFEFAPDISDAFLEKLHTPAGLNIGAETPEEIALSILAEILSVVRKKEVFSLKKITGKIHN
ncbi:xanthine/CO dehydrogenase XdhC/CoxF family maturation factor [Lutibacter sp. Hel_I_33_5]|uniref:XdhC family protein n=1 Tax=Lutibacter sp. Hel_I_33_5 TaxID=1566289 RepID=UPI0011A6194C|nr:XdhC/CoxI family protein [Lutibacter sp. Hel_I_33_5]TVZ56007.1 xanthine/CO dehydrogenase XdhC/CoxF family maturation factor [Lutibacter sp. Hel_I_33_5]